MVYVHLLAVYLFFKSFGGVQCSQLEEIVDLDIQQCQVLRQAIFVYQRNSFTNIQKKR